ncbi:MAG TPA: hypothetical protein VGF73_11350 [Chthoniobacterales bacterium]|jgi:N-acetylneuraminic acid mutarotase
MLTLRETPFDPVQLHNGDVLAAGGDDQSAANCELYDPAAGKWSITGDLNEGRSGFRATLLDDGQVLVAGGYPENSPGFVPDSELYDSASGTWDLSGSLNRPRALHVQLLLPDGRVLIAGGYAGHPSRALVTQSTETFDPSTGQWTLARPMNMPRGEFSGALLNGAKVFVAGGTADVFSTDILSSIEQYDPVAGR